MIGQMRQQPQSATTTTTRDAALLDSNSTLDEDESQIDAATTQNSEERDDGSQLHATETHSTAADEDGNAGVVKSPRAGGGGDMGIAESMKQAQASRRATSARDRLFDSIKHCFAPPHQQEQEEERRNIGVQCRVQDAVQDSCSTIQTKLGLCHDQVDKVLITVFDQPVEEVQVRDSLDHSTSVSVNEELTLDSCLESTQASSSRRLRRVTSVIENRMNDEKTLRPTEQGTSKSAEELDKSLDAKLDEILSDSYEPSLPSPPSLEQDNDDRDETPYDDYEVADDDHEISAGNEIYKYPSSQQKIQYSDRYDVERYIRQQMRKPTSDVGSTPRVQFSDKYDMKAYVSEVDRDDMMGPIGENDKYDIEENMSEGDRYDVGEDDMSEGHKYDVLEGHMREGNKYGDVQGYVSVSHQYDVEGYISEHDKFDMKSYVSDDDQYDDAMKGTVSDNDRYGVKASVSDSDKYGIKGTISDEVMYPSVHDDDVDAPVVVVHPFEEVPVEESQKGTHSQSDNEEFIIEARVVDNDDFIVEERADNEEYIEERVDDEEYIEERVDDEEYIEERVDDEEYVEERVNNEEFIEERVDATRWEEQNDTFVSSSEVQHIDIIEVEEETILDVPIEETDEDEVETTIIDLSSPSMEDDGEAMFDLSSPSMDEFDRLLRADMEKLDRIAERRRRFDEQSIPASTETESQCAEDEVSIPVPTETPTEQSKECADPPAIVPTEYRGDLSEEYRSSSLPMEDRRYGIEQTSSSSTPLHDNRAIRKMQEKDEEEEKDDESEILDSVQYKKMDPERMYRQRVIPTTMMGKYESRVSYDNDEEIIDLTMYEEGY